MKTHTSSIPKLICGLLLLFNIYMVSYGCSKLNNILYEKYNNYEYNYNLIVYDKLNEELKIEEPKDLAIANPQYEILNTFIGSMTGYGPDCKGCSGVTSSGYDLRNGNIYYTDKTFGTLRVLAADKSIPLGTVIKVSGLKIYNEPFLGIVLDRGGVIKDKLMDLAFSSENDPLIDQIGYSRNITYEILRYGW